LGVERNAEVDSSAFAFLKKKKVFMCQVATASKVKVMDDDGDNHYSHSDLQVKLVIMADDLGIAPERDEGIFAAFENGIVTSASLFVNGSTSREAGVR
jgi:hypothetical protein